MSDTASSIRTAQPPSVSGEPQRSSSRGSPGGAGLPSPPDEQPTIISRHAPLPPLGGVSDSAYRILQGKIIAGDHLGHFELTEYVGGGGMGRVFRGTDTRLGRPVALKVLPPEQASDPETLARFQNEAQSAARLDHDNIARIYHAGEDRGLHYIVFEFVDGVNIRTLVEQKGPLPLAEAVSYTLQVAEALTHAAAHDVVHRDIKPSNVLITPAGRVKLIDMGLARLKHADPAAADLTASGVTLGTFDYISPEQARDPRNADVRSDLYSLGCTFFYMLTGRPPFSEGTVLQKLLQHQGDQPPELGQFRPDLPEEANRILRRLLAKDPRHRYATPAELVEDLLALARQVGLRPLGPAGRIWGLPQPRKISLWQRHLPWLAPVAALVCIVVGLKVLWDLEARWNDRPPPILSGAEMLPAGPPASANGGPDSGASGRPRQPPVAPPSRPPELGPPSKPEPPPDTPRRPLEEPGAAVALPGPRIASLAPEGLAVTPPIGPWDRLFADRATGSGLGLDPLRGGISITGGIPWGGPLGVEGEPFTSRLAGPSGISTRPIIAGPTAEPLPKRAGLLVVNDQADAENHFPSLEAACSAAVDNDVIELRFNGLREQRPVHLSNQRLTIRAGNGYSPRLVFRPLEPDPVKYPRSMFNLSGGRLTLLGVTLELHVPRDVHSETWSLFEARGTQPLRLERCWLTIRNASDQGTAFHQDAAFFRVSPASGSETMLGDSAALPPTSIELADCIVRGEAILLKSEELQPARLSWDNGLLSITDPALVAHGGQQPPKPGDTLHLELRHLTAALRSGLCRLTDTQLVPHQLPADIDCTDSILIQSGTKPLIAQEGVATADSLRRRIAWNGDRNFYPGFDVLWTLDDLNPDTTPESLDFEAWQAHWGTQKESHPSRARIARKKPPASRLPSAQTPDDFALDSTAAGNPAVGAASDGHDAGLLADRLPPAPAAAEKPNGEKPAAPEPPAAEKPGPARPPSDKPPSPSPQEKPAPKT